MRQRTQYRSSQQSVSVSNLQHLQSCLHMGHTCSHPQVITKPIRSNQQYLHLKLMQHKIMTCLSQHLILTGGMRAPRKSFISVLFKLNSVIRTPLILECCYRAVAHDHLSTTDKRDALGESNVEVESLRYKQYLSTGNTRL